MNLEALKRSVDALRVLVLAKIRQDKLAPPTKGDRGEKKGDEGDPGRDGEDGAKGDRGEKGDRGDLGRDGVDGKDGKHGRDGKDGKDGKPGAKGDKGDKGEKGDRGLNWRGPFAFRRWYEPNDAVEHAGSSWVARERTRTTPAKGSMSWDLLAQRGADGAFSVGVGDSSSGGSGGGITQEQLDAAIAAHEAASDPHFVYLTQDEADAAYDAFGAASGGDAAHVSAVDPHPQYLTSTEGDAAYALKPHNHTAGGETLVPEAGLDIGNAPIDRGLLSWDQATGKPLWLTSTEYAATSFAVVTGTLNSGNLASIQTRGDADYIEVQEVSGVPGHDTQVTFEDVETFSQVRINMRALEGGSHLVEIGLWNVVGSVWDTLTSVQNMNGFTEVTVNVDNAANYIDAANSDRVIVRFYHPLSGNTAHQLRLEWIVLLDSLTGGGGITEHSALSGLQDAGAHPPAAVGLGNVTNDAQLKRAAGDINTFTEKVSPVSADVLLGEDSAAGFAKIKIKVGNLPTGGGGGSTNIKAATVSVPAPAMEYSTVIVDTDVSPSSQITPGWGNCNQSDANHPAMGEVGFNAIAGTGQFTMELFSLDRSKLCGDYKVNYLVG